MARKQSVVSSPLKLPKAPPGYSERDQDHTRRLIELALIAYTQQIAGVIDDVAAANIFGKDFPPVSPIMGCVGTFGDASNAPYILLQNPIGSNKLVVLYEIRLSQDGVSNQIVRLRTTDAPATLGGTQTTGLLVHRNEDDVATIVSTLTGCTTPTPSVPFGAPESSFSEFITQAGQSGYGPAFPIVWPGHHPVILLPGHALEMQHAQTGAATRMTAHVCFDELPLTTEPGVPVPLDLTAPISSCWATLRQAGSVNDGGFIQFFNPGPKFAKVTGLYVVTDTTQPTSVRRTAEPIAMPGAGATLNFGVAKRMNRASIEAITCQLRGAGLTVQANDFATASSAGPSFWRDKTGRAGIPYHAIVGPFSGPMVVKPGSAIEISVAGAGVGLTCSVMVMWDEVESI